MMAGIVVKFGPNSRTILPIWPTFPPDAVWMASSTSQFAAVTAWDDDNKPLGSGRPFLGCSHFSKAIFTISFTD